MCKLGCSGAWVPATMRIKRCVLTCRNSREDLLTSALCVCILCTHAAAIWCLWLLVPYEINPAQVLPGALAFFDVQRSGSPLPDTTTQWYPWLKASAAGQCITVWQHVRPILGTGCDMAGITVFACY
jgi:hypothetical protein